MAFAILSRTPMAPLRFSYSAISYRCRFERTSHYHVLCHCVQATCTCERLNMTCSKLMQNDSVSLSDFYSLSFSPDDTMIRNQINRSNDSHLNVETNRLKQTIQWKTIMCGTHERYFHHLFSSKKNALPSIVERPRTTHLLQ